MWERVERCRWRAALTGQPQWEERGDQDFLFLRRRERGKPHTSPRTLPRQTDTLVSSRTHLLSQSCSLQLATAARPPSPPPELLLHLPPLTSFYTPPAASLRPPIDSHPSLVSPPPARALHSSFPPTCSYSRLSVPPLACRPHLQPFSPPTMHLMFSCAAVSSSHPVQGSRPRFLSQPQPGRYPPLQPQEAHCFWCRDQERSPWCVTPLLTAVRATQADEKSPFPPFAARFSPDDKYSRHRVTVKKRCTFLLLSSIARFLSMPFPPLFLDGNRFF